MMKLWRWRSRTIIRTVPLHCPMALPSPDPQYVLRGANDAVNTLCFHCRDPEPELPILFSGSSNGLIPIWNMKTHRIDRTLDGHGGKSVYWLKTLCNRNALLSQGRDQNICLWDLAEGRSAVTDSIFTENVGFCKCSLLELSERRWLLATPWRGLEEVRVWELPSKTSVCTLKPEADAKLGMPMCLKLWQLQQTYNLTNPGIAEVTLRQDKKILATAGWDHRIRLFGWKKFKPLAVLDYHKATIHCVAFSDHTQPSKRLMAAASKDHRISVWSIYNQT
ncbi:guanine nucleotide-binding protein subunit beta-like protein 1 isoform X5 [Hemicordylus capensis]|uniref:guanine nucleotide-binding protein subunit beta-like protein 1 isoform X5 n=1 Tax=Hemicordylus capensis TaxID=884348 RepID=UPI0023030644|nr:guanine nucleotide-binding protein subunit beta-like protein 1 isoform X5 [Hemicordylus capensis]